MLAIHVAGAWARETHEILVEAILADLAGNSVERVFDDDLTQALGTAVAHDRRRPQFAPVC